ncbi:MAG: peptide chain release factor aRF-1 [Nanoarchaeota archaeon]
MVLTYKQRFEIKKFVKELERYRGRHTELVSVYVPAGYDLNKVVQQMADEQGTASNIKSSSTRKNVTDALERMIQHLRLYKRTPPNGLLAFSGNISDREGVSDCRVWSLEPPVPINQRLYRCDKEFVLDILKDMMAEANTYGMVVMDRRDATLALLRGKTIIPLVSTHSQVPGKFRAGGQSAARFGRLREEAAKDHFRKVADYMKDQFLMMKDLKGILIGGPSVTTNDFMQKGHLTGDLMKKVIAVRDLSYTGDFGLQELLERSADVLASEEVAQEKELMNQFLRLLGTNEFKVSYGKAEVMKNLSKGVVDKVLLSESLEDDEIEKFEEEALKFSTEVKMISTETREGQQLRDLGKVAAILRYEVHPDS